RNLGCPVVAAAQLNRDNTNRTDKTPYLSDLRESGAIEQAADAVILLHREDYYDESSPRAGEIDMIVAKNRSVPTGTVTLSAQRLKSRFVSMAQDGHRCARIPSPANARSGAAPLSLGRQPYPAISPRRSSPSCNR